MRLNQLMLLVKGSTLIFAGRQFRCAIGKGGFSTDKKEGDGCTPIGVFPLRECWYRADRMAKPITALPLNIISEKDGWCDDPKSPDYNRHVKLPYGFSHEPLWRDDHAYDLIIPLGYNDRPVKPGQGSAIFLHIAKPGYSGTEGCIALKKEDLLALLPQLTPDMPVDIRQS